jgi:AcrR family transcriptional regulator
MPKVIDLDHLFRATVRVFSEHGYSAATTQEIASQAGVSEVTLYRRFGTKAKLVAAALSHVLAQAPLGRVEASDDVRTDLAAIAKAYADTNRTYGAAVTTLMTDLPRHPELRQAVPALLPNLQRAAAVIATHQHRGALTPGDPLQKVVTLIAPLLAEGLWRSMDAHVTPPPFAPEAVAEAFLQGHATASTRARAWTPQ